MPVLKSTRFYVYVLVDPRDNSVFYVGKGCRERCHAHFKEYKSGKISNAAKFRRIAEIVKDGFEPISQIVFKDMTEANALKKERHLIGKYGLKNLANIAPGSLTRQERAVEWAKAILPTVKTFDEWCAEKPRSDLHKSYFKRWMEEVVAISENKRLFEIDVPGLHITVG